MKIEKKSVIEILNYQKKLALDLNDEICADCIDAVIYKVNELPVDSPWHTGTPTEEGCYYAVVCKGWKRPYNRLAFVYDGKLYCLDDSSDFEDFPHEVIAYQKITPYKEAHT